MVSSQARKASSVRVLQSVTAIERGEEGVLEDIRDGDLAAKPRGEPTSDPQGCHASVPVEEHTERLLVPLAEAADQLDSVIRRPSLHAR